MHMPTRNVLVPVLAAVCALQFAATMAWCAAGDNWPQFRGEGARGISEGDDLPETWSASGSQQENIAWKQDIPGRGWSSPIVWGNRVFLTTAVAQGALEEPKKGLYFGGERKDAPDLVHQWKVYCLDLETGNVLWERQVHEGKPTTPIHIKNSYASETPVTDGERVYVYFGNLGLWCFNLEGEEVWNMPVEPRQMRYRWGTAASPVLFGNRLYIVNDNEESSYLLAIDKMTGKEVWRVARDEKSNWSTPYAWENGQRTEIVTPGSGQVRSYDLDGNLLWSLTGMSSITIATPYAADGLLYISSGYVGDKRRPLYAIRPGASADISLGTDKDGVAQTSNAWIAWSQPLGAPYNPSTLVYGGRLYVLYDRGQMSCFNASDGAAIYERQQIPDGRGFTCSPWAYNDRIFCLNEDGTTFVIKAGDTFECVRTNPLAEDDMGMATPAIAGDRLLIRSSARLYCIRNGGQKK